MGSGSIKEARGETCSVEKVSLAPAHEQANATADRLKGNADHVSEMQKGVDEKPNSFLPEDVWERVAMQMTTREWVQVSGTCKAMSRVQLRRIALDSSAANAIVWAAKHSRTTEYLSVKLHHWDQNKSTAVLAAVQTGSWDLRQLHVLHVWVGSRQGIGSTLWSWVAQLVLQQANQDAERWMADMLSSASNAKQVHLTGVNLAGSALARCGFPPLAHLTSLLMTTPLSPEVCSSIQQLPALQTLSIFKEPGLPDMQALPPLDFACCRALRDLILENVLPSTIQFSPILGSALIWQNSPAMLGVWDTICHRCTILQLKESHSMSGLLGLSWQLDEMFLSPCPMLFMLDLQCKSVGHVGLPLLLDLPSLQHLKIMSIDAHVLLSERTSPKEVQLAIKEELDLFVQDVAAFAAGLYMLSYNEPETVGESTQLLLDYFNDPRVWQKTTQTRRFTHHRISRLLTSSRATVSQ